MQAELGENYLEQMERDLENAEMQAGSGDPFGDYNAPQTSEPAWGDDTMQEDGGWGDGSR